ncbi:MAG: class I SAM-dependent rRNA methyltransferase [Phycisphaerae bacterium]|nr:class I SAM-dependent rRNA methyltransferase [Phycisphaerae bacterium]
MKESGPISPRPGRDPERDATGRGRVEPTWASVRSRSLPREASCVDAEAFGPLLSRAMEKRRGMIRSGETDAFRVFSGAADGLDGVFIDVYGEGAVLMVHEGIAPRGLDVRSAAGAALRVLGPAGVRAVYLKPFAKDRSGLGGALPAVVMDPTPAAGAALPEELRVHEHGATLEVRLYDGLSTGLFLDQRENRRFVRDWCAGLVRERSVAPSVLNTFAYTCAFSVAAARAGALATSVDVSGRYLGWGKRNFGHNAIDAGPHRFAKMDTFEFLQYARRKGLRYDVIVLDPPSFASGSKRKGQRPWSSVADYPRLVREAAGVACPGALILASTNTRELCLPGRLERAIIDGLGVEPVWVGLPGPPADFAAERGRMAARAFEVPRESVARGLPGATSRVRR